MTTAIFTEGQGYRESEFLALDTSERIELFDGSLHVSPGPTPAHQFISGELRAALLPAARQVDLHVHETVNVRLGPDRISIPDLVITTSIDYYKPVMDAAVVRLVCEILSPSNAATDKVLKMHYYATAGIAWYLLIEPNTGTLHLHELVGDTYVERSVTEVGNVLRLTDPVVATIDPERLLPPH